jgi:hypothetical protein
MTRPSGVEVEDPVLRDRHVVGLAADVTERGRRIHFSAALLNAAIVSAPWRRVISGAVGIAVFALAGLLLLVSGILLPSHPALWLFPVGGASLLLLFVGIHNAWDSVTYIALVRGKRSKERRESDPEKRA